jgi:Camelysin metallo-endopeptidase
MTAKKKLAAGLGGVVALGATVALTAGTFSYFSDSATANGGSADVNFGKLTLKLQDGAVASQPITVNHAAPGDVLWDKDLSFRNTGDMAGELRIGFTENDNNTDAFNQAVQITIAGFGGTSDGTYSLADWAGKGAMHLYTLQTKGGESTKGIHMKVTLDPNAGNALQGASGGFKLQADLRQSNAGGRGDSAGQDPKFPANSASQP